jgi:hypothetical protein
MASQVQRVLRVKMASQVCKAQRAKMASQAQRVLRVRMARRGPPVRWDLQALQAERLAAVLARSWTV